MKKRLGVYVALFTGFFIGFFLSGKIIYIPQGTHKGGLISAIGVLIIIISMTTIGYIINLLIKRKEK